MRAGKAKVFLGSRVSLVPGGDLDKWELSGSHGGPWRSV